MKTLTPKAVIAVMGAVMGLLAAPSHALTAPEMGTLNITVLDENGVVVPNAPVFIYGEQRTKFVGGKEIPGTATLNMKAGTYRISSAVVRKMGDYLDRFASREAHVEIVPGDNTVVTLQLVSLDDAAQPLELSEMHKMGVNTEVARGY